MNFDIVIIGSSTGGPKALYEIIYDFDAKFDLPIIIIQHIPATFENSLVEVLNTKSRKKVEVIQNNSLLENNVIYVARGGYQAEFISKNKIIIKEDHDPRFFAPSITNTIISALNANMRPMAVILSGLSTRADGLEGCREMKKKSLPIILQNRETSSIYGMQKVIKEAGFYDHELPLHEIPKKLYELL